MSNAAAIAHLKSALEEMLRQHGSEKRRNAIRVVMHHLGNLPPIDAPAKAPHPV